MDAKWGSDVPISMPDPPPGGKPRVIFGGFAFGPTGICHDITEARREELATPFFVPPDLEEG